MKKNDYRFVTLRMYIPYMHSAQFTPYLFHSREVTRDNNGTKK